MNGTGTCQGDSGSSLQYTSPSGVIVQYGVVSFGAATGCGTGIYISTLAYCHCFLFFKFTLTLKGTVSRKITGVKSGINR